jgi:hypothetical protein
MMQYVTQAQGEVLCVNARDITVVAGRGFGKGLIQAARLRQNYEGMPGCNIGLISQNSKRMLTNVLPSWLFHLESWGLHRNYHYALGIKPPKAWGWRRPVIEPLNWENVLSFYNGSYATIISQDRKGTSNSLSLDALQIDEAKLIDFTQLKDETIPANRGNNNIFGHVYYHHGIIKTSDMPTTKRGSWFLNDREHCDADNVRLIEGLVVEYDRWSSVLADKRARGVAITDQDNFYLRRISQSLNMLRADTLFYKEYSSIENIEILGEDFIRKCKRDLPPATFRTTILCRRVEHCEDSFYSSKSERNLYTASDIGYLDNLQYDFDKLKDVDSRMDADLDPASPLWMAFDANANINWCVVGQPGHDNVLRIVKSFYTKYSRRLPQLIDDVCAYYAHFPFKCVVFCFDATFVGNNYGVDRNDFHTVIEHCFRQHGWAVRRCYIGAPWRHPVKQELINAMFRGLKHFQIMINEENNPDLLISIDSALVVNGSNQKDKSDEKSPETEENRLESRTDGSDAFDTLCIAVEAGPRPSTVSLGGSGFTR